MFLGYCYGFWNYLNFSYQWKLYSSKTWNSYNKGNVHRIMYGNPATNKLSICRRKSMEFIKESVHFSKSEDYVGFYVLFILWKRAKREPFVFEICQHCHILCIIFQQFIIKCPVFPNHTIRDVITKVSPLEHIKS